MLWSLKSFHYSINSCNSVYVLLVPLNKMWCFPFSSTLLCFSLVPFCFLCLTSFFSYFDLSSYFWPQDLHNSCSFCLEALPPSLWPTSNPLEFCVIQSSSKRISHEWLNEWERKRGTMQSRSPQGACNTAGMIRPEYMKSSLTQDSS